MTGFTQKPLLPRRWALVARARQHFSKTPLFSRSFSFCPLRPFI